MKVILTREKFFTPSSSPTGRKKERTRESRGKKEMDGCFLWLPPYDSSQFLYLMIPSSSSLVDDDGGCDEEDEEDVIFFLLFSFLLIPSDFSFTSHLLPLLVIHFPLRQMTRSGR